MTERWAAERSIRGNGGRSSANMALAWMCGGDALHPLPLNAPCLRATTAVLELLALDSVGLDGVDSAHSSQLITHATGVFG